MTTTPRPLELLAPARNAEVARQAILHGADAVYIGADGFGARSAACNTVADMAGVADMAHTYGARVYATVNTIVYDHELKRVERLVHDLYRAGVDALIVQDMGLLRLDLPPVDLHASTQCDIRTPDKARFLESLGFSQLVLPRELSLDEIAAIRAATTVPLEAFVHGALCVSYSGDCQASQLTCGRSANRGECAQICRHDFDLMAGTATTPVIRGKHLLSLSDLNRADSLADMADAGISSFKIEGRLKEAAYVKNIVALYRRRLDALIAGHPDKYRAASQGTVELRFTPEADRSFNRGFTSYFLHGRPVKPVSMASVDTPKSRGRLVGTVTMVRDSGHIIDTRLAEPVVNGDGLGYFDPTDGTFVGFRVNRADDNRLHPARPVFPPRGVQLWRNSDKAFNDMLDTPTAVRTISVDMTLRHASGAIALDIADTDGHYATATLWPDTPLQAARSPQPAQRRRVLERLGDTPYRLDHINDTLGDIFIPASVLTDLRRRAIDNLDCSRTASRPRPLRRREAPESRWPRTEPLSRHDNVANHLAGQVYLDHGATIGSRATECIDNVEPDPVVMTTRYCLRRQLGACLREGGAARLPEPLTLVSGNTRLRPQFDCGQCIMRLHLLSS